MGCTTIRRMPDAAFTGDTLLYEGSSDEYLSTLTVTKRLVITGAGYFQDENPNTNVFPAQVRRITLNRASGGDASTGAAGTIIQGWTWAILSYA
jgi:hypothetical protein